MAWLNPYPLLLERFGPQHWWPGVSPLEVMVGAVLTQNTSWRNVERAIDRLKAHSALSVRAILEHSDSALAELIRPAGYFNIKAQRLKALCAYLAEQGVAADPSRLRHLATLAELRAQLLAVRGVGPETADSILLYALELPVFVVDAYTRRIFGRLGLLSGLEGYADIQGCFHGHLPAQVPLYNEYHALIVRLGKDVCRPRPRCGDCPLAPICPASA